MATNRSVNTPFGSLCQVAKRHRWHVTISVDRSAEPATQASVIAAVCVWKGAPRKSTLLYEEQAYDGIDGAANRILELIETKKRKKTA